MSRTWPSRPGSASLRLMAESPIRVIGRAVKILDCFLDNPGSLGITELARQTRLSKSTVHHVVSTLVDTGLLAVDPTTRRYRLGPKVAQLGRAFGESTDLREMLMPAMTELRDLTNETVSLHVPVADERAIIAQVESRQSVRRVLPLGATRPLNLGAAGVVLMSGMADDEIRDLLKRSRPRRLTQKTVTDPNEFMALIRQARLNGYSTLSEQMEDDVGAIAVAIYDHTGGVPACILISGPIQRWNAKVAMGHWRRIKSIADAVSHQMGWRPEAPAADSAVK